MKTWVRRLRAAMVVGATWAVAWFGAGMALLLVLGPDAADVPFPLGFGLLGFIAGMTFSGILGIADRHRRLDQISPLRASRWGALGGSLLSVGFVAAVALSGENLWSELLVLLPVFALAGAASAGATMAVARRPGDQVALPKG